VPFASLRSLVSRLRGLVASRRSRQRREQDFDEEIDAHLELLTERFVRSGLSRDEARRAARVSFGNPTLVREVQRERRTLPSIESFASDLRQTLRMCRRSPGFTAVAILTLGIGIGTNTTLFTALNAIAFRLLPVADAGRLARLERWFASENRGNIQYAFSYHEYRYIGEHTSALRDLVAASWLEQVWDRSSDEQSVAAQFVSPNYFDVLGVRAAAGRLFNVRSLNDESDESVVVISHGFWRRRFDESSAAVGSSLTLNGIRVTIIGVAPAEFVGTGNPPQVPDVWAPASLQALIDPRMTPSTRHFQIVGHLAPSLTFASASAQMNALASPLDDAFPARDRTVNITVERATFFGETNDPRFQQLAAAVMAAVSLVLLVACANVANLLLARAGARQKEIGMRVALGASRARVVRQLLTESLVLGVLAGGVGLLLSMWGSRLLWVRTAEALQMFIGGDLPVVLELSPDARIFAYTLLVSLATGVMFGLSPALRSSRPDLNAVLKAESGGFGSRRSRSLLRSALVAGQVAISMALLLIAGLLVRGVINGRSLTAGFDTAALYDVIFPRGANPAAVKDIQRQVAERVARASVVTSVALTDRLPLAGTWTPPLIVETPSSRAAGRTLANRVSETYFATLGIPILRGRTFSIDEIRGGADVAIISEGAARSFWQGHDPVGTTVTLDLNFRGAWKSFVVVGVVKDVRSANISRVDPSYVYLPLQPSGNDQVLIHAQGEPRHVLASIKDALSGMDPSLVRDVRLLGLERGPVRLQKLIPAALADFAAILAAIALALAAAGIYGVLTYFAVERTPEIGVRMALGASRTDVLRLVLTEGFRPVAAGGVAGLGCAILLSALLRATLAFPGSPDLLNGIGAFDPLTFIGLTLALCAIALGASLGPAWRATRVDPLVALRHL